jgi:hypothetical protein
MYDIAPNDILGIASSDVVLGIDGDGRVKIIKDCYGNVESATVQLVRRQTFATAPAAGTPEKAPIVRYATEYYNIKALLETSEGKVVWLWGEGLISAQVTVRQVMTLDNPDGPVDYLSCFNSEGQHRTYRVDSLARVEVTA